MKKSVWNWNKIIGTSLISIALATVISLFYLFTLVEMQYAEEPSSYSKVVLQNIIVYVVPFFIIPIGIGISVASKVNIKKVIQGGLSGMVYGVGIGFLILITRFSDFYSQPKLLVIFFVMLSFGLSCFGAFIQTKLSKKSLR